MCTECSKQFSPGVYKHVLGGGCEVKIYQHDLKGVSSIWSHLGLSFLCPLHFEIIFTTVWFPPLVYKPVFGGSTVSVVIQLYLCGKFGFRIDWGKGGLAILNWFRIEIFSELLMSSLRCTSQWGKTNEQGSSIFFHGDVLDISFC